MTVVRNEMEMGENNPERILFEKTLATMYQWHNYGKSTIGARSDVENVDIPRLPRFLLPLLPTRQRNAHRRRAVAPAETPCNGSRSPSAASSGRNGACRCCTRSMQVQDGERSVTLRRSGGVPLLFAAYHVPPRPRTATMPPSN